VETQGVVLDLLAAFGQPYLFVFYLVQQPDLVVGDLQHFVFVCQLLAAPFFLDPAFLDNAAPRENEVWRGIPGQLAVYLLDFLLMQEAGADRPETGQIAGNGGFRRFQQLVLGYVAIVLSHQAILPAGN
jgi:hypothetical protein